MMKYCKKYSFYVIISVFFLALVIQPLACLPVSPTPAAGPPAGEEAVPHQADAFAEQAAAAVDDTLLGFKNGLTNIIEDSARLSNIFSHFTESLKKYAPRSSEETGDSSAVQPKTS